LEIRKGGERGGVAWGIKEEGGKGWNAERRILRTGSLADVSNLRLQSTLPLRHTVTRTSSTHQKPFADFQLMQPDKMRKKRKLGIPQYRGIKEYIYIYINSQKLKVHSFFLSKNASKKTCTSCKEHLETERRNVVFLE
jgi:hypothetical protein